MTRNKKKSQRLRRWPKMMIAPDEGRGSNLWRELTTAIRLEQEAPIDPRLTSPAWAEILAATTGETCEEYWCTMRTLIEQRRARFSALNTVLEQAAKPISGPCAMASGGPSSGSGNAERADLIERFRIPLVWKLLSLPGEPGKSCASPFREDRDPSFSVFDDGKAFKDFATNEAGNVFRFYGLAKKTSPRNEYREFKDFLRSQGYAIGEENRSNSARGESSRDRSEAKESVPRKEASPPPSFISWEQCVAALSDEALEQLAEWRGFSDAFCHWLGDRGLIGLYNGYFCLPIYGPGGQVIAEQVFTPKNEKQKSFFTAGAAGNISPLVLGALPHAKVVLNSESVWDVLAIADRTGWYEDPNYCFVATRGTTNYKLAKDLPWLKIDREPQPPKIVLLTQHDSTRDKDGLTPNEKWVRNVRSVIRFRLTHSRRRKSFRILMTGRATALAAKS